MAADRTSDTSVTGLDPDEVGSKTFETAFRGFDTTEVQAYLITLAAELRSNRDRIFDLEMRLTEAERVAEAASVIDEQRLTTALGDEVAGILEASRLAASKVAARAEAQAATLIRDGEQRALQLRTEAEALLDQKTAEAREAAAVIDQAAEDVRKHAAADAAAEVEAGKQQGRQMIAEAQVVRERILKDLARRRRQTRQQIEQLRAGRERLLEAFRVVRETTAKATEELEISLPAAKAAAETAGRGTTDEDDLSVEQLERMLDAARDAGFIESQAGELEAELHDVADGGGVVDDDYQDDDSGTGDEPLDEGLDTIVDEEPAEVADLAERRGGRRRKAEQIVSDEPAPAPLEGRRSSSVRVFRRDGDAVADHESQATDGGADEDEVVIIEEVVIEEIVDDESGVEEERVAVVEEIVEVIEIADDPADDPEVITGLFARIRADHDAPGRSSSEPQAPANGNGHGNGHGSNGHGNGSPTDAEAPAATAEPVDDPDLADEEPAQVRRDRALTAPSRGLSRILKRVLADEQNEVLDAMRRGKKVPSLGEVLPDESEHALRYAAAARGELGDAAYAGATCADEGTAERPEVDDLAAEISVSIVTPLRARLEALVAADDGDRDALLDALRDAYRDTKGQRIDECVHHFAGEAFNRGVRAASTSGLDVRMLVDAGDKPALG